VLSPTDDTVRLFVHSLAAAVWVGGQITLAALVPMVRRSAPEALTTAARACARLAWPSFVVLVITGAWNLARVDVTSTSSAYQATVLVKVLAAAAAGVATAVHSLSRSTCAVALGGAIGVLASLAAMFLGLLLQSGR
jgi:putative copper export protein